MRRRCPGSPPRRPTGARGLLELYSTALRPWHDGRRLDRRPSAPVERDVDASVPRQMSRRARLPQRLRTAAGVGCWGSRDEPDDPRRARADAAHGRVGGHAPPDDQVSILRINLTPVFNPRENSPPSHASAKPTPTGVVVSARPALRSRALHTEVTSLLPHQTPRPAAQSRTTRSPPSAAPGPAAGAPNSSTARASLRGPPTLLRR